MSTRVINANIDYTKFRGDKISWRLAFGENITGWTIFFTLKQNKSDLDADAKIAKDITTHSDPVNGITYITVSPVETAELEPGEYFYDMQFKKPDGTIKTIQAGRINILEDITRRT